MTKLILALSLYLIPFWAPQAFAYPEMIRHGYPNCNSCHVNPAGGGALTSYGRQISAELMSTGSVENEGEVGHSLLTPFVQRPEWFNVGGDIRFVQLYRDTPQVKSARFIPMQADLEAALSSQKWTIDLSLGAYMTVVQSRRHYVHYRPTDEWSFRFGKFQQAFGLLIPDHTATTRKYLDWDEGSETYNFEAAWLGEKFTGYLTANLGRPDDQALNREKGISVRSAFNLGERFQVGAQYLYGSKKNQNRHVVGFFGSLGFTTRFFLLSELDYQALESSDQPTRQGWVEYQRLGYELMQGLNIYFLEQGCRLNFKDSHTAYSSFGIGAQFFPRPHFEILAEYQKQRTAAFPSAWNDFFELLVHYWI